MAYNEALTNRIRESISTIPKVEEKKMFRGIAFMVDGKLCITVGDDEIMLRIDPVLHEKLVESEGCRSVIMRGRITKGYIYVHENLVKNQKDLEYWISLALDFNKRAKASKKRKK